MYAPEVTFLGLTIVYDAIQIMFSGCAALTSVCSLSRSQSRCSPPLAASVRAYSMLLACLDTSRTVSTRLVSSSLTPTGTHHTSPRFEQTDKSDLMTTTYSSRPPCRYKAKPSTRVTILVHMVALDVP